MFRCYIKIDKEDQVYKPGDVVRGIVNMDIPRNMPLTNLAITMHCLSEVNFTEMDDNVYHERKFLLNETFAFDEQKDVTSTMLPTNYKNILIPYYFVIPQDPNLPSSFSQPQGFIKYYIGVKANLSPCNQCKDTMNDSKEFTVRAPKHDENQTNIIGTSKKLVILNLGTVLMRASIGHLSYLPGELVHIMLSISNDTLVNIQPGLSLHQEFIFSASSLIRTITKVNTITTELKPTQMSFVRQVEPKSCSFKQMDISIPEDTSGSIKSPLITLKHFVRISVDIPHGEVLQIDLPIVVL